MSVWCNDLKLKETTQNEKHTKKAAVKNREENILPLYCPDSMMPSVVEAKLLGLTQDSERFKAPGTLG